MIVERKQRCQSRPRNPSFRQLMDLQRREEELKRMAPERRAAINLLVLQGSLPSPREQYERDRAARRRGPALVSGLMVVRAKNPVHSVLFPSCFCFSLPAT